MSIRQRLANMIAPRQRAAPIPVTPEVTGANYGQGLGDNQPDAEALLRENVGVADIATRAIANRVGSLNPQVKVSRQAEDGTLDDEVLDDHVLKATLDRPHPDFSRQQLMRLTAQYIVTVGEAYWLKVNNGFGVPGRLQPLPPQSVEPVVRRGVIERYTIKDGNGALHNMPAREVIRFWWPDPETIYTAEGYLGPNATNTDAQRFANEYLRSHYQSDATPPIIFKPGANAVQPTGPDWDRYQNDWSRKYHNRTGSRRMLPAKLPTDWDVIQMAVASGADITPLLDHWQTNQLMNFGVPASVLGRVVSGDRSSAETNQWVMDRFTVLPIATMIAETLTARLAPDFDESLFVEFEDFVSDDKDFTLAQEAQDLALKVRSPQQILRDRESDPEDAPWGELPVGTLADQPYTGEETDFDMGPDDPGAMFEPDDSEDEEPRARSFARAQEHFSAEAEYKRVLIREKKWRPRMERALRFVIEAQRKETVKRLRELAPDRARAPIRLEDLFNPLEWARLFALRVDPVRVGAYVDSAADALSGVDASQSFTFTPTVAKTLREHGAAMVTWTGETTRKRLAKALAESTELGESVDQAAKRINQVFGGRRKNATTIARTELLKATQDAQIEGFKQSGVVEWKQWNDNRDPEVRDTHVGSLIPIVPVDEAFTLADGVTKAMHPGDFSLPVHEVANCRCFVTPVFEDPKGINP